MCESLDFTDTNGPVAKAFNGDVKGMQLSIADDPKNSDQSVLLKDAITAAMGRQ